jgi:hypothetical protein
LEQDWNRLLFSSINKMKCEKKPENTGWWGCRTMIEESGKKLRE